MKFKNSGTWRWQESANGSLEPVPSVGMRSDAQQVLNGTFRQWMLEVEEHMEKQLQSHKEPELTFEVCGIVYRVQLLDWPGIYTKETTQ